MNPRHLAPLALVFASTLALAQSPVKVADGMVVNAAGMTVYTFDKDTPGSGKSACNGPCAQLWPPVMADAGAMANGDLSVVTRDDGTKQWAWKGKPIYLYAKDMKPGERTGDNFKDVWHVIKP